MAVIAHSQAGLIQADFALRFLQVKHIKAVGGYGGQTPLSAVTLRGWSSHPGDFTALTTSEFFPDSIFPVISPRGGYVPEVRFLVRRANRNDVTHHYLHHAPLSCLHCGLELIAADWLKYRHWSPHPARYHYGAASCLPPGVVVPIVTMLPVS